MITLYKTNTMLDASNYVMEIIKKVDKNNLSVMHNIIVPDRTCLEAERALLKAVKGSFNVQVRTFRRLANDVLPSLDYLSKQAGIMALSGIIKDCKDQLVCYTKGIDTPGFVADMYDTISMMKYCKITPQKLDNNLLPRSVRGKAHDIALLYDQYLQYTKDKYIDSADKMDLLCQSIATTSQMQNSYFYLYDFDNFSKQEFAIVEQLMLHSKGVVVACCASDDAIDGALYLNDIYNGVLDICKKNNITPNLISGNHHQNDYVKQIGTHLYRYKKYSPIPANDFLQIFSGESRANEVYALACQIQQYVRSGGRFKDIYVVTSDINKYVNAISTIFPQFDIPYFCDRQFCLANHPYSQYVLDYLLVCKNNAKRNNVLAFVKNYLFYGNFDKTVGQDDDVFQFENYCLQYNVSYNFDRFTLGTSDANFAQANRFRKKFCDVYHKVQFAQTSTVENYVQQVQELLEISSLTAKNNIFASQQEQNGLHFQSKVTMQVAEKFQQVLVQAQKILGQRTTTLDEFHKLLLSGLTAVNISVIPVTNDSVVFANMAKARKHDVKFLALLGANYGAMPIVKSDCKLLSDSNIDSLAQCDVLVEPMILTENKRERFSLYQLLQEPSCKLYVSYCTKDGADSVAPSPFVSQLCKLFVDKSSAAEPEKQLAVTTETDENVYTQKQAIAKVVQNNRKMKDFQLVKMPSYSILAKHFNDVTCTYIFTKDGQKINVSRGKDLYLKNATTSVSQLTDFYKCPYRFFVQYGLNVKPRIVSELKSSDLGTILHAVLEKYVVDLDVNETDEVTTQKAESLFEEIMQDDFYRGLRNDKQMAGTLEQLKTESVRVCKTVKQQLANSDFTNFATELSFGKKDDAAPAVKVDFDGGSFNLVGVIDRVDTYGDHFIVIDYKSGGNAAKYGEKDLYIGQKMQLLVYVKAARQHTKLSPAGFYYFNVHDNFTDSNAEKEFFYNGRTLKDVEIASRIDKNLPLQRKSQTLGLKLTDKGAIDGHSQSAITAQQMLNQEHYATLLITKAGNLMDKGFASVSPYEGACKYCDYKDICDFDDVYTYSARKVSKRIYPKDIDKTVE